MLEKFLNVARGEIGYKENKNNDTKYGVWFGMNNNPWCAMFVSWCANQVGILNTKIPKYSGCGIGWNWFTKKNLTTKIPKAGYIGFLKPTVKNATSSHTFIVEEVNGDTINTIEGNLNDSVIRNTRNINDTDILGFGIVEFEDTPKLIEMYVDNVDYEGLNVRNVRNNQVTRIIKIGTKIEISKIIGDKAYLNDDEYVYKKYLNNKYPLLKIVTGADNEGLNVRKGTSIFSRKITCLKNGTKVKVYSVRNKWSKISPDNEAWVYSSYLK